MKETMLPKRPKAKATVGTWCVAISVKDARTKCLPSVLCLMNHFTQTSLISLPTFSRCSLSHNGCNLELGFLRMERTGGGGRVYIAEFCQLSWGTVEQYGTTLRKNEWDDSFPVVPIHRLIHFLFAYVNAIQTPFFL